MHTARIFGFLNPQYLCLFEISQLYYQFGTNNNRSFAESTKVILSMIRTITIPLLCLFIFSFTVANCMASERPAVAEDSPCELTLAWSEWPPYITNKNGVFSGLNIDLIRWIEKEMDCKIILVNKSWSESLIAIKEGTIDMRGTASMLKERLEFARFSTPYMKHIQVLTMKKGEAKKFNLGSLKQLFAKGFKIGVIDDAYLGKNINSLQKDPTTSNNFLYFNDQPEILTALQSGEIDGTFMAPFTLDTLKNRQDVVVKLEEYPLEIVLDSLHFMFSKKSVENSTVEKFNQALSKVKLSQEYKAHPFWSSINE